MTALPWSALGRETRGRVRAAVRPEEAMGAPLCRGPDLAANSPPLAPDSGDPAPLILALTVRGGGQRLVQQRPTRVAPAYYATASLAREALAG